MQVYLVGGAVRDKLLGRGNSDRDYVVVGSSADEMLRLGYKSVGKDFPVFLHPNTHEEYALARTERKVAKGYHGFEFYANPYVTLEQDLMRRDLTINAIAEDLEGQIFDPYHGVDDIEARLLRHVSPAFAEDPVRILRVARFAARFADEGFSIAQETMQLMSSMVEQGEVDALVAERVWKEVEKALEEPQAMVFFQVLRECGALKRLMPELDRLFGVPQPIQWHPEEDTGLHTMMVLEQAIKLSEQKSIRFAALVHDLGKGVTPVEQWPSHKGHEEAGIPVVKQLCQRLRVPKTFTELALLVTEFHLYYHRLNELKATTIVKLFGKMDAFRRPERFDAFLLACEADMRGRPGFENVPGDKTDRFRRYLSAARQIEPRSFVSQGYQGKQIGEQLYMARVNVIKKILREYPIN